MNKTSNKTYWDNIAEEYHNNVGDKGDIRHEKIINPVVSKFIGDLKGNSVLDAGCGNGYLTQTMAKTAKKVIGIDFTEKLIEKARDNNRHKNVKYLVGNLENLPFANEYFNTILCNMVLMDVENLDNVTKEITRVLKNNGILVVSLIHPCFENPPRTYSIFDNNNKRIGRVVQNYFSTGLVVDKNQNVVKGQPYQHYHYMISDYLNVFAKSKLCLQEVSEPNGNEILGDNGGMNDQAPTFIVFKYQKIS